MAPKRVLGTHTGTGSQKFYAMPQKNKYGSLFSCSLSELVWL